MRKSWAEMAGMSIAKLEDVDRAIEDKLEFVMQWLIEQGESPERLKNLQVARVRFKQRYADRLGELLEAYARTQAQQKEPEDQPAEQQPPPPPPPSPSPESEPEVVENREESTLPSTVEVAQPEDWAKELLDSQAAVAVDSADLALLRSVQQQLLIMVRDARKQRADQRPAGGVQRRYLIPEEWAAELEQVANHPAVGLGQYRAVRLAIELLFYCKDHQWPILQRELTPERRVALAMGFPKFDHTNHKAVRTDLPKELIERLDAAAAESGVDKSDVVCVAVDMLLGLLERWIRIVEAAQ